MSHIVRFVLMCAGVFVVGTACPVQFQFAGMVLVVVCWAATYSMKLCLAVLVLGFIAWLGGVG